MIGPREGAKVSTKERKVYEHNKGRKEPMEQKDQGKKVKIKGKE